MYLNKYVSFSSITSYKKTETHLKMKFQWGDFGCRYSRPTSACAYPEGVTGGLDPLKNHKNIGFLSNTGLDTLKDYKATKPALNVGPSSACQYNAI